MIEIAVQNPHRYRSLDTRALRRWLEAMLPAVAPAAASFGLRLVDDREIQELNLRYRGLDEPTDVLSFAGGDQGDAFHLGDVVISVPTARSQAAAQGLSIRTELKQLILHGILHCLGYDHDSDAGEMDRMELEIRRRWVVDEE